VIKAMASGDVECAECQAIIVELISASEELWASSKGDEARADVIALRELVQGESGEEARSEELFRKYKFDTNPNCRARSINNFICSSAGCLIIAREPGMVFRFDTGRESNAPATPPGSGAR
jgi:hypothetical protein